MTSLLQLPLVNKSPLHSCSPPPKSTTCPISPHRPKRASTALLATLVSRPNPCFTREIRERRVGNVNKSKENSSSRGRWRLEKKSEPPAAGSDRRGSRTGSTQRAPQERSKVRIERRSAEHAARSAREKKKQEEEGYVPLPSSGGEQEGIRGGGGERGDGCCGGVLARGESCCGTSSLCAVLAWGPRSLAF